MGPRRAAAVAAAIATAAIASCGTTSHTTAGPVQTLPSPRARAAPGAPPRIAVILMENEEYGDIIGSSDAPYLNRLAHTYGVATSAYAIAHPSLPNYLALTGGSTFGITDDCTSCQASGPGLASQLSAAGLTWRAYMEDLPHPCFTGASSGDYAKKHDPFVYYPQITSNHALCNHVVPLSQLSQDERLHHAPAFTWISPNLCHDMHDCSVATGDRFLSRLVPPLLRALGPHGLLFLTFDEGTTDDGCCRLASGGHIVTIVAGGGARRHATLKVPVDHYSVLQTIEDLFGLARLAGAGCACTPSLAPLLS